MPQTAVKPEPVVEHPIIMSAESIRAILDKRKTQTRRVVKPQPSIIEVDNSGPDAKFKGAGWFDLKGAYWRNKEQFERDCCPWGRAGDYLWVRETWADTNGESGPMISYKAGGDRFLVEESYPVDYSLYPGCQFTMWCGDLRRGAEGHAWRSPIHMPRWASRITLEITGVKIERIQDISLEDCVLEGHGRGLNDIGKRYCFGQAWNQLNEKKGFGWNTNCLVWVISFRLV